MDVTEPVALNLEGFEDSKFMAESCLTVLRAAAVFVEEFLPPSALVALRLGKNEVRDPSGAAAAYVASYRDSDDSSADEPSNRDSDDCVDDPSNKEDGHG